MRYDRVQSSDGTIKISFGNDVDRKVLDLKLNSTVIIDLLETNPKFQTTLLSVVMKLINTISQVVFEKFLTNEGIIENLAMQVEQIINNDQGFKEVLEQALKTLLAQDEQLINTIAGELSVDSDFMTELINQVLPHIPSVDPSDIEAVIKDYNSKTEYTYDDGTEE